MKLKKLTLIIEVIGILIGVTASVLAIIQYNKNAELEKIKPVYEYMKILSSGDYLIASRNLSDHVYPLYYKAKAKSLPYKTFNIELLTLIKDKKLEKDILLISFLYNSLAVCVNTKVCEYNTAKILFKAQIGEFHRLYYPFVLYYQEVNSPKFYEQIEQFLSQSQEE